jgi:hypothetical protein
MGKDRLKVREKPPSSFLKHELPWDCRIMHRLPSTRTHQEQKWTWTAEESKRKIEIQTGQRQCVGGKQGFKEDIGCCCLSLLSLPSCHHFFKLLNPNSQASITDYPKSWKEFKLVSRENQRIHAVG